MTAEPDDLQRSLAAAARALARLTEHAGLDLASGKLVEALRRTRRAGVDGNAPADWLATAAEQCGLRAITTSGTLEDAAQTGDSNLLSVAALTEDGALWLVLLGSEGHQLRHVIIAQDEGEQERTAAGDALAAQLGIAPDTLLHWVTTEVAAPCATAASSPADTVKLSPLTRLARLLRPDRGDLWTVVLFSIATGVLLLATPIAVQALVNFVAFGGAIPPLVVVALLLFLGLAFAAALTATQAWIVEILQRRLFVRMVADLAARLPRVTLASRGHGYGPELVNRFFDIVTIQKVGSALLLDGLSMLLSVLVGLVVLAFYHPLLLGFDILLLAIIGALVLWPARRGVATAIKESKAKYAVAAWLEEIARNRLAFKATGTQRWVAVESDRLALQYVESRRAHYRVVFGQVVGALALQAIASTALLAIGGFLVIRGSLTLGQLVAAELIVTMVVSSVAKVGKHLEGFYDLMAAVDKVGQLLDLPTESAAGEHPPAATGSPATLELDQVTWGHGPGPAIINQLTFHLAAGSRLGVTGESGAGKSQLMQLLWGLSRPDHGAIRLDGRDLRDLAPDYLRRAVGLATGTEVVAGSIRENVQLGRSFVDDDAVRAALEDSGLTSSLLLLPDGLDTRLEPDGHPLSAGEVQSLMVARAIAARPRLLLFDGSLDQMSRPERNRILDTLFAPTAPWTLVISSSAVELLQRCDQVLRMPGGQLEPPATSTAPPASGSS